MVALFTFIGKAQPHLDHRLLWGAMACFTAGLAFNLGSIMTGFLAQAFFAKSSVSQLWNKQAEMQGYKAQHDPERVREERIGNWWEAAAIGGAVLSLVGFIAGSICALSGVTV